MSQVDEQDKFVGCLIELIFHARTELGYQVTLGHSWRTIEQQALYYVAKPRLTKTLKSKHLDRKAQDLNFFKDGKQLKTVAELRDVGDYWTAMDDNCVWGGNWKFDPCHFEWRG